MRTLLQLHWRTSSAIARITAAPAPARARATALPRSPSMCMCVCACVLLRACSCSALAEGHAETACSWYRSNVAAKAGVPSNTKARATAANHSDPSQNAPFLSSSDDCTGNDSGRSTVAVPSEGSVKSSLTTLTVTLRTCKYMHVLY